MGTDGNGLYELDRKNNQVHSVNLPLKNIAASQPDYSGFIAGKK